MKVSSGDKAAESPEKVDLSKSDTKLEIRTPTDLKRPTRMNGFKTQTSGKSETTYFYSMEKMTGKTTDNRTDSFSEDSRRNSDRTSDENQTGNNSLGLFDSNKKAFNSLSLF